MTIDERTLSVQLGVQDSAAKAYLGELKAVGLLTDENKPTPLAQNWRLDERYSHAVQQIIEDVYPASLVALAPVGDADRQKVVSWFLHDGLGKGSAGNKAATYLLISSPFPSDTAQTRGGTRSAKEIEGQAAPAVIKPKRDLSRVARTVSSKVSEQRRNTPDQRSEVMPLNVNVQIHISSDAGSEQIEAIFSAMRRYLYETPQS